MASTQLELLGENIDLVFFVFAAAIFLIELAEFGFKGKFQPGQSHRNAGECIDTNSVSSD